MDDIIAREDGEGDIRWEGVPFMALYHHDARTVRAPGLFAFVRRAADGERTMLFVDHADCIAGVAVPSHPLWSEARWHGMNEVHVCLSARERIDRLQLRAHLLRRLTPMLNPPAPAAAMGLGLSRAFAMGAAPGQVLPATFGGRAAG